MSRQDANAAFALTSFLYGGNADYIDTLYARYEADPQSVDAQWQSFFASLKDAGHDVVQPVRPDTIAKSLAIGNPADGPYVLDVARRTGGAVADVGDDEIVDAIRLLAATEGIFGETAVGVTLATTRRLLESGQLDPEAETVIINSGDGLKTLDAVAGSVPHITPIRPTLEAFAALESSAHPGKAVIL